MNKLLVPMNADGMVYALSEGGGYNPLSAIFELIDNSLKEEVNSTFSSVSFEFDENSILSKIYCADDGLSMDEKELIGFFSYGNKKQNDGKIFSLSKYGIGGKAASLYLGNELSVFCKKDDSDHIIGGRIYNGMCSGSSVLVDSLTEEDMEGEEIAKFKDLTKSNHGTVIVISNLKPRVKEFLSLRKLDSVKDIIRPIRIAYSKLIETTGKKIIFNGTEIKPLNYFGGKNRRTREDFSGVILGEEKIKIDGYSDMRLVCVHCSRDFEDEYEYDIPLMIKHSGLHIFRNNRCVTPEGLSGHVFTPDTHHGQGFRAFLYCDGSHDELFGNTFNKTVTTDDNFNESLTKVLRPILTKYSSNSVEKRRNEGRILAVKENEDFDVMIKDLLNKIIKNNKYTRRAKEISSKEKNRSTSECRVHHKRPKSFETIGKVTSINGGVNGKICEVFLENGKYSVNLNVDHPLYTILRKGNSDLNLLGVILIKISERIALDEALKEDEKIALRKSKYYDDICESSELVLHGLFKDYSYLYDDEDEEIDIEEAASSPIEESENCIGVGISSDEIGVTAFTDEEAKNRYLETQMMILKELQETYI